MPKLTNKEKTLNALLNTNSIAEASKACKLSEKTIYRYLETEDFQKEYRKAGRSLVETSIGQIQKATSEAVETLKRNQHCEVPSVEVRAAQIILETAYKGIELMELEERLEKIENELKKSN